MRKITKSIASYIERQRKEGHSCSEIRAAVLKKYGVRLSLSTIYRCCSRDRTKRKDNLPAASLIRHKPSAEERTVELLEEWLAFRRFTNKPVFTKSRRGAGPGGKK